VLLVIPCVVAAPAHARTHAKARAHAVRQAHARESFVRLPRFSGPRATGSYYIRTVHPTVMHNFGCRAGERRANGIVILDFGRLYYDGHSYGTQLFSGRLAANRDITRAMKAFARGYAQCLPTWSRAQITLSRGTSNYEPQVPSTFEAGRRWARETVGFAMFLRRAGLGGRIRSAAADDAEPAWNPGFHKTRDFFRGYRAYEPGYMLYNYGSLDGGVGHYWNARQLWFVTGGMRYVRAIPEIYYTPMARQWGRLAQIVAQRFGRVLEFAGLMTQHSESCSTCGFRPHEAHRALLRALPRWLQRHVRRLPALTNIHVQELRRPRRAPR